MIGKSSLFSAGAVVVAMLVAAAFQPGVAQPLLRADPKRPTDKISADLAVSKATFIACFYNVTPAQGFEPDAAYQRANKAILLPCLQKANPAITNDGLDAVMDRYRP
jgi:Na+/H+-dicarboxylate symporter